VTKAERDMFQKHHEEQAANHSRLATSCVKAAEIHHALSENTSDPTCKARHADAEKCFKGMASGHAEVAQSHLDMHKSLGDLKTEEIGNGSSNDMKAVVDRLDKILSGVVPTQVSPIPLNPSPRQTIVPRHGQQVPADAISKVDVSLRHLVDEDAEAAT
jgi:hypothetical protein